MPSLDKTRITLRMQLKLRAKLRKRVRLLRDENPLITEQDVALSALQRELDNIEPDAEDIEWAMNERKKNEINRHK